MNVEISPKSEELLRTVLESGRFRSLDEIIAAVAGADVSANVELASMLEHVDVDVLARQQGVGVVDDFRNLKVDFWPQNESVGEFLSSIYHDRGDDAPRVD